MPELNLLSEADYNRLLSEPPRTPHKWLVVKYPPHITRIDRNDHAGFHYDFGGRGGDWLHEALVHAMTGRRR